MQIVALALAACALQDAPDGYQLRLHFKAENKHNMGTILKRTLADLDGIQKMAWDSNSETVTLTLALGSVITRAQIEEALPKVYSVDKYEIQGLPGTVSRAKGEIMLSAPRTRQPFVLKETNFTASWFRDLDKFLAKSTAYKVWGEVEEVRVGKGLLAKTVMTVSVTRVENCRLPESKSVEPIVLRLFLDDLKDAESSGAECEKAVARIKGVTTSAWDAEASILNVVHATDQKLDLDAVAKACEKQGRVAKVMIDGLAGRARRGRDGLILKSTAGEDYTLTADAPLPKLGVAIAEKMIEGGSDEFRVSGELTSKTLKLRTIRPLGPGE
ncbi:MAG TPA: hypothetical protein VI643_03330 [Planctomycetota bacterium]|nr:hypothetical protein [Planctomycetota bacterium]